MKKWLFCAIFTALSSFIVGCASRQLNPETLAAESSRLTLAEAQYRRTLVAEPQYQLSFQLDADSPSYTGTTEIHFQWKGHPSDTLWLDFNEGTVSELKVNEKPIDFQQKKYRVLIPGSALSPGLNRVSVKFKQNYSVSGSGLYRFTDPEDKATYIYSDLEPFNANRVFPCFDQPDLKAIFEMTVTVPASWQVIAYDLESGTSIAGNQKVWNFPKSLPISTYVWSMHAGQYRMWKDEQARIPSRLFARKSLARYVNAAEWFTLTRQGFDFYEKYFDEPYAFKKYDQIIVPDFNMGAMENIGSVTFSEKHVSRGKALHSDKRELADTILHEMAHMWFGDLVTMKWWDDLWLNESFATYMSALCMSKATEFSGEETWREFYNTKTWAYSTDLQVTTHPIEANVESTDDAFVNFDGITYGKGASLIKQLDFYLGAGGFQRGVQIYFNRHRFGNATLTDFMTALEEGSGKDLGRWSKEWLRSKGLNTLAFQSECANGRLKKVLFTQEIANGDTAYRGQKTRLGLFVSQKNGIKLDSTLDIEYSGRSGEYVVKDDKPCPVFIYSNIDDQAYFLPRYTDKDLKTIVENYTSLESPFLRQTLLFDLWQSARRGEIRLSDFADILYKALGTESDPAGIESLFLYLKNKHRQASIYYYTDFENNEGLESFEDLIWELTRKSPKNSEARNIYQRFYLDFARSKNHLKNLNDLLNPEIVKKLGIEMDQDQRWVILRSLAEAGDPRIQELITKELARDSSHQGHEGYLAATSRIPNKEQKKITFDQVVSGNPPRTNGQVEVISKNLFPITQRSIAAAFQDDYFTALKKVRNTFEPERLDNFLNMIPEECFYGKTGKIEEFLKTTEKLSPIVSRKLRIMNQEQQICRLVRSKDRIKKP